MVYWYTLLFLQLLQNNFKSETFCHTDHTVALFTPVKYLDSTTHFEFWLLRSLLDMHSYRFQIHSTSMVFTIFENGSWSRLLRTTRQLSTLSYNPFLPVKMEKTSLSISQQFLIQDSKCLGVCLSVSANCLAPAGEQLSCLAPAGELLPAPSWFIYLSALCVFLLYWSGYTISTVFSAVSGQNTQSVCAYACVCVCVCVCMCV